MLGARTYARQVPPEPPHVTRAAARPGPRTQRPHGDAAGFPAEVTARAPGGWGAEKAAEGTTMAWVPRRDV